MAARQEETQRRRGSRKGAWMVLFALGATMGLGCELFTLDRAKLYEETFDASGIDVTPPRPEAAPPDPEPDDAGADGDTDADTDAAGGDAGTDSATETGTDTGTGTDAADAADG